MLFPRVFQPLLILVLTLTLTGCSIPIGLLERIQTAPAATPTVPSAPIATLTAVPTLTAPAEITPPPPSEPLWVANETDGTLLMIDTAANAPAVLIPTNLHPYRVLSGAGAVWALDRFNDTLLRINPVDFEVEATLKITQGDVLTLAVGEGGVWIGIIEAPKSPVLRPHEEYVPTGGVLRIDPQEVRVTGYAPIGPVDDLSTGAGAVWALVRGQIDTPIFRIDPLSLQSAPLTFSGTHDWLMIDTLAAGPESLWLYSQAFGKLYHASFEGHLYAEIQLPQRRPEGMADLLVTEEAVWLATPWGTVLRIHPSGEITAEIETGAPLSELQAAAGAVWALSPLTGTGLRIDPAGSRVSARVELGSPTVPTPRVTATAIQRAEKVCEEGPFTRLAVGMRAFTNKEPPVPNRLRAEAGIEYEVVGRIQPGEIVRIEEGPVCSDGWVWWKVRTETGGYTGWAAEGDANEYWLNPLR
jgi:hypothetical protein